MAFSFIQAKAVATANGPTVSAAYASNNALGNLLFAGWVWQNDGITAFTSFGDTQTNAWTQIGSTLTVGGYNFGVYFAASSKAGANTVSLVLSRGASNNLCLGIAEYSGQSGSLDASASSATFGASFGPVTTTLPNDLLISIVTQGGSSTALTAGSGSTLRLGGGSSAFNQIQLEDTPTTTAGSYTPTGTGSTWGWLTVGFSVGGATLRTMMGAGQ